MNVECLKYIYFNQVCRAKRYRWWYSFCDNLYIVPILHLKMLMNKFYLIASRIPPGLNANTQRLANTNPKPTKTYMEPMKNLAKLS